MKTSFLSIKDVFLIVAILAVPAFASARNLATFPIGSFGGLRVFTVCYINDNQHLCSIDTGSPTAIAAVGDVFDHFPVVSKTDLKGVGTVEFACPIIQVDNFTISGQSTQQMQLLLCSNFSLQLSPMIGMSSFDHQVFTLDFPNGMLEWSLPNDLKLYPFARGSFGGQGLLLPVRIGGLQLTAGFDTGAPVTLVDPTVVMAHPEVFKPSSLPISDELRAARISVYELHSPITVGGIDLSAGFIQVTDLSQFSDTTGHIDMLIGANHLAQARWAFDLTRNLFGVSPR